MNGSFSTELRDLSGRFAERSATLAEVLAATQGRGFDLLLIILMLPFVTLLALPGMSTPFGTVALIIGARMALGQKPWLPQRVLAHQLPAKFLSRLLRGAEKVVRILEHLVKPRLSLFQNPLFARLSGFMIVIAGFLLALPLPIPFTNTFPALAILLLAAATMERDGLFFLAGGAAFILTLAYFALLVLGGAEATEHLWKAVIR
jgi:hypothetical protein